MKYLKSRKLLLEGSLTIGGLSEQEWILSKKDDIIECSYELTDLPYNFYHCGNINKPTMEMSDYLNWIKFLPSDDKESCVIRWIGVIPNRKPVNSFDGSLAGILVDDGGWRLKIYMNNIVSSQRELLDILDDLLPNLESTLIKLNNIVFEGINCSIKFDISFYNGVIYIRSVFTPRFSGNFFK